MCIRDRIDTANRTTLIHLIHQYGEEPKRIAERYADAIIAARPLETTGELAEAIRLAHVGKWQKTHPATRTFQAFRIAINDELHQVRELMPLLPKLLKKGGRVGIISFHSLEAVSYTHLDVYKRQPHKGRWRVVQCGWIYQSFT